MTTPWLNSTDIIESVKRKISMPIYQTVFSEDDILKFATEEMMISQVPSVLSYHEEYYTFEVEVPIVANRKKYSIPERAIGIKLRDLFLVDSNGNVFPMTRIAPDDRDFFQSQPGSNQTVHKYFMQGNDVVLSTENVQDAGNKLLMTYYIRPSRLVSVDRAATITAFSKTITVSNADLVAGDTVTIADQVFTAVASGATGNQFNIGISSIATATNLASAIAQNGTFLAANNNTPSTNVVNVQYELLDTSFSSSNDTGLEVEESQGIVFDQVPANITNGSYVDFLQTRPGHKIRAIEIRLSSTAISGTSIIFNSDVVPEDLVLGDYVCAANESIIPYLPTDLHTGLAERTSARILAALGDKEGLASANEKIAEIEARQGTLLSNRVEGSLIKVRNRNTLIGLSKIGIGRRRF